MQDRSSKPTLGRPALYAVLAECRRRLADGAEAAGQPFSGLYVSQQCHDVSAERGDEAVLRA